MTSATYHHLFALAGDRLAMGEPVVLDATFLAPEQRARAGDLAPRHGAPLVLLETTCDEATVAARFAARLAARTERTEHGQPASDASLATSLQQRAASTKSPPAVPPGALLVPVNTAGPLPISLEGAWASLAREELVLPRVPSSGIGSGAGKPRAASLAGVITPVQVQPGGVSV